MDLQTEVAESESLFGCYFRIQIEGGVALKFWIVGFSEREEAVKYRDDQRRLPTEWTNRHGRRYVVKEIGVAIPPKTGAGVVLHLSDVCAEAAA
jgi:hypothetical protein